ncbi:hypothetical protein GCM10025868_17420 [Angustibacter aerolatus]|uniref:Uncharacterized protein n=1 Tax=Angustibacter aerolatus TaxID=1162965 RepID=A0ABQ6JHZ6_9ACTN|nr:hypothetical protein [Angustibacter aerolatus]GMA86492.1 hypothetical protein GCM10025868_17420 [Angustibacter aerolatus]
MADGPDVTDALGVLGNALEKVERARGRLYDFHQATGAADLALSEAIDALREVGLTEQADRLDREPGRTQRGRRPLDLPGSSRTTTTTTTASSVSSSSGCATASASRAGTRRSSA